jgi:hypothetical protein
VTVRAKSRRREIDATNLETRERRTQMAKQRTKASEKKNTRARQVRDLATQPVGARKAASVKGGMADLTITKAVDKSSTRLF